MSEIWEGYGPYGHGTNEMALGLQGRLARERRIPERVFGELHGLLQQLQSLIVSILCDFQVGFGQILQHDGRAGARVQARVELLRRLQKETTPPLRDAMLRSGVARRSRVARFNDFEERFASRDVVDRSLVLD